MSERWEEMLGQRLLEEAHSLFEFRRHQIKKELIERCESPIERLLAVHFADLQWFNQEPSKLSWLFDPTLELGSFKEYLDFIGWQQIATSEGMCWGEWTGFLVPQVQVGRYRVDFLAGAVFCQVRNPKDEPLPISMMVIECDGHEYHERTKKQAARDKKRDRELQAMGMAVFRFTGSQIHNDPGSCASEVISFFDAWAEPHKKEYWRRISGKAEVPDFTLPESHA